MHWFERTTTVSVAGSDVKNFHLLLPSHQFWHFLQFTLFERSGLVYTLSQGAVLPIRSNRYFLDI